MLDINTENSAKHWEFINVKDRTVLDLGCGRWNKVEYVEDDWLTTPEHFIHNGATRVIASDMDPKEIEWFENKFNNDIKYTFILQRISSTQDIQKLYDTYQPDCVKCDIEGYERLLLQINPEIFKSIKEYYIETHGTEMYHQFVDIFTNYGYTIREQIDLTHTNGYCKVIFAYKK